MPDWGYDTSSEGTAQYQRLLSLAEQRQWKLSNDLPWNSKNVVAVPGRNDNITNPFNGFAPYEALDHNDRASADRERHRLELSEILHGEVLAMLVSAQLVNLLEDPEAKKFAAVQVADEARHISFFQENLHRSELQVAPPSQGINNFCEKALLDSDWRHKILHCQIIIESLALAQFSWLRTTKIPAILDAGLARILEDEARHVKFGVVALDTYFRNLPDTQKELYVNYVLDSVMTLSPADNHLVQLADQWNWNSFELRHHLRTRRLMFPKLYQARFRQLSLNLRKIGLLTPGATKRLKKWRGTNGPE